MLNFPFFLSSLSTPGVEPTDRDRGHSGKPLYLIPEIKIPHVRSALCYLPGLEGWSGGDLPCDDLHGDPQVVEHRPDKDVGHGPVPQVNEDKTDKRRNRPAPHLLSTATDRYVDVPGREKHWVNVVCCVLLVVS